MAVFAGGGEGNSMGVFDFGLRDAGNIYGRLTNSTQDVFESRIFSLLANVADVKSLVIHPYTTTHSQLSPEELAEQHITPSTVRLSIGTEHIDDIIADLSHALDWV